jgi:hypothetical protein
MMALEFSIVGGYISVTKDIFIKEMLDKDSILRRLLKWKSTASFKEKHPMVIQSEEDGLVTIDFTDIGSVILGDDPKELLDKLKARYKEGVKGWLAILGTYDMMGGTFNFKVDLNSKEVKVDYM